MVLLILKKQHFPTVRVNWHSKGATLRHRSSGSRRGVYALLKGHTKRLGGHPLGYRAGSLYCQQTRHGGVLFFGRKLWIIYLQRTEYIIGKERLEQLKI